jgi:hypothetical protein
MEKSKYNYRVTSSKLASSLEPQTFTITLDAAIDAAYRHGRELPGCTTRIENRCTDGWNLWQEGQWIGCGESTRVAGTNGGWMKCGAMLTDLMGNTTPYFCAKCDPVHA